MEGYAVFPKGDLIDSLMKITKRMGGQNVKAALEAFEANRIEEATAVALNYYDKTYTHSTGRGSFSAVVKLEAEKIEPAGIAQKLVDLANENGF